MRRKTLPVGQIFRSEAVPPSGVTKPFRQTRLIFLCLIATPVFAQTAELSGLIYDPSGLPVPKPRSRCKVPIRAACHAGFKPARTIQRARSAAWRLRRYGRSERFQILHENGVVLRGRPARAARLHPVVGSNAKPSRSRHRTAAQFRRRLGEHGHRQPVRREYAAERAQLQLAHRTGARRRADPVESVRAGPVQRQWPAAGCELLHGGRRQRQYRKWRERRRDSYQGGAGQTSRPPMPLVAPATSCRSMRWKNSASRPQPSLRNMDALRARRYRWSRSPAPTRFTALRSNTSATTSSTPTTGSPMPTAWRGPNCARTTSAACWEDRSGKTSSSSSVRMKG